MAADLPRPALASPRHRVPAVSTASPPSAPRSLPEVGPCVPPSAWCLAELLLKVFWHHPVQTELHESIGTVAPIHACRASADRATVGHARPRGCGGAEPQPPTSEEKHREGRRVPGAAAHGG